MWVFSVNGFLAEAQNKAALLLSGCQVWNMYAHGLSRFDFSGSSSSREPKEQENTYSKMKLL